MTRFVVDAGAVLRIIEEDIAVAEGHKLLAPTLLRSQVLTRLYEAVQRGELDAAVGLARLERIRRMSIRYLGDGVLRRRAWELAARLGWPSTYDAEYVALTQLQADALLTLDRDLAQAVEGLVRVAGIEELSVTER